MDPIKIKILNELRENSRRESNSAALELVRKIRAIETLAQTRGKVPDVEYQGIVDKVFQTYGVVVQVRSIDGHKEIQSIAGLPLREGDVEYFKTTPAGYDHFLVHRAMDFRDGMGFASLDGVCRDFNLNYNRKSVQVTRLMEDSGCNLMVAELFAKGYRHGKDTGKGIVLPFEVMGLNTRYREEGELLRALARRIYRVAV